MDSRFLGFIGGTIAGLGVLAMAGIEVSNCSGRGPIHNNAVSQGREYLAEHYPGVNYRLSCMGQDTDGNGYVTCFANTPGQPDVNFECSEYTLVNTNPGCKPIVGIRTR